MSDEQGLLGGDPSRREFIRGSATLAGAVVALGGITGCEGAGDAPLGDIAPASGLAPRLPDPEAVVSLTLTVNGVDHPVTLEPRVTLADALRDRLGLTGTKVGCDRAACGACTVLIDGRSALACSTLAVEAEGSEITTIEGLAVGGQLHPIQAAFVRNDALQCGFCTPGMVMSCKALLDEKALPTEADVRDGVAGNLCRCGTYPRVFAACLEAAEDLG